MGELDVTVPQVEENSTSCEQTQASSTCVDSDNSMSDPDYNNVSDLAAHRDSASDSDISFEPPKKRIKTTTRVMWTNTEIDELKMYFSEFLSTKTTPGKDFCKKAIEKSKMNGGQICRRAYHLIVKKISNMNKK